MDNDQDIICSVRNMHYHAKDALEQRSSLIQLILSWFVEPVSSRDRKDRKRHVACAPTWVQANACFFLFYHPPLWVLSRCTSGPS
jgi:hypothetical protein